MYFLGAIVHVPLIICPLLFIICWFLLYWFMCLHIVSMCSSTDNIWGWMACSIILMDRWDTACWTEGQKGTDSCRSSLEIRPVSSCNYNGNSTLQMDAFTSKHNKYGPCVSESWRLWGKQLMLNGGTSIISPIASPAFDFNNNAWRSYFTAFVPCLWLCRNV